MRANNVSSSTFGTGGACDTLDGTDPATSNPLIENSGQNITFDFGDISNTSGSSQIIRVRYTIIVLDIAGNQDGDTLTNTLTWGPKVTHAPEVEIVEPDMTIQKSASSCTTDIQPVVFAIELEHSLESTADAFDVVVTDQIPDGLIYDPTSLVVGGSATLSDSNYNSTTNTLTLTWNEFRLIETAIVTFEATYAETFSFVNIASVEWTSLEIDPALPGPRQVPVQRSPYNPNSTERWYDPAAPAGVDNYEMSASVTVACDPPVPPETGFAPERVTELPEQPLGKAYVSLGDLWIEIPSLGVRTTIAGVPHMENSWDVSWLWDQVGWLQGTAFPTWAGNSAITAHVYLSDGTPGPFVDLHKLRSGDQIIIHAYRQRYIYEVRSSRILSPRVDIFTQEEYPWLTLITCRGYDEGTDSYRYRVVVRAVQIKIE